MAQNGHPPPTALALASFDDSTPIVIDAHDAPLALTVDDVLRYIAPNAPRGEALAFLLACKSMRLNPFLKEAFLTPAKDKWVTIVAKSGYLRCAQRHDSYNGHAAGIVAQPYDRSKVKPGQPPPYTGPPVDLDGSLLPDGHLLVGGWAKVWRHGIDQPITSRISMAEYDRRQSTWVTIPCTMIRKVALVAALREAFCLGGYDEAEMPVGDTGGQVTVRPEVMNNAQAAVRAIKAHPKAESPGLTTPTVPDMAVKGSSDFPPAITPANVAKMKDLMARVGMSEYAINQSLANRGVDRVEDLDDFAAVEMIRKLDKKLDKMNGPDELVARIQEASPSPAKPPRQREPGDDDEPFDDAEAAALVHGIGEQG